jgi:5-methylcytosine-specific restriction endonuclease McrA
MQQVKLLPDDLQPLELKRSIVFCECCGDAIVMADWRIKKTTSFYCENCFGDSKRRIECDHCGEIMRRYPANIQAYNYCSRQCSGSGIHSRVYQSVDDYAGEIVECKVCGLDFYLQPNQIGEKSGKYCSRSCFHVAHRDNMKGEKNPSWRGGCSGGYGPNWKQERLACLDRDNYTCQRCGLHEDEQDRSLDVHHIVPLREFDGDFERANKLSNLVALCRTCHKFVEWHGEDAIDTDKAERKRREHNDRTGQVDLIDALGETE